MPRVPTTLPDPGTPRAVLSLWYARVGDRVFAGETRGRSRAAQFQVEMADAFEPGDPLFALAANQRMLEEREQCDRREFFRGGAGYAQQQRSCGRCAERRSGAVVGGDPPAGEQR